MLDIAVLEKHWDNAADTFNQAAVLQREIANRLLDRLNFIKFQPKIILDYGAQTGLSTRLLANRYSNTQIFALDISSKMLEKVGKPRWWKKSIPVLHARPDSIPLANHSVDFVFSNLWLHWMSDLKSCLSEIQRVLKPGGLFLFSMLGPDTLTELRQAFAQVDENPHVHPFIDMHHIGDMLLKIGFKDPVMDMENFLFTYSKLSQLFKELKATGSSNCFIDRFRGLMGKYRWQTMLSHYESLKREQLFPATFEVVYGHAWGSQQLQINNEILIPVERINRSIK